MPVVPPGSTVLVSGANGYIAFWIVRYLLEHGFIVRGTVRSEAKGVFLKNAWKSYGDKFECVVVDDITKPGAFDSAVQGVDAILHTSSPFHFNAEDPAELIDPALKGTTGILESTLKHGLSVKRVVVLSSCASVSNPSDRGVLTEKNWNTENIVEVNEKGRQASQPAKYRASKSLAERSAWDFVKKHQGTIGWDLVTLCPPFVFGPFLHECSDPAQLNTSAKDFHDALFKGSKTPAQYTGFQGAWVDVRDIALAHVNAIEKDLPLGVDEEGRFVVVAGMWVWQDFFDTAHALGYGEKYSAIPKGTPGAGKDVKWNIEYANSKVHDVLGLKFRSKEETTKDTVEDYKARGWI